MRILYVVPFVPWPVRVRSYNLIPRLARSHDIHLLCVAWSDEEAARAAALEGVCKSVTVVRASKRAAIARSLLAVPSAVPLRNAYFRLREAMDAARQLCREHSPDVIYVERWRALQYVQHCATAPIVCDPTDSMALYNERLQSSSKLMHKIVGHLEAPRFRRAEPHLGRHLADVIFCSEHDRQHYLSLGEGLHSSIVPNGVNTTTFFPSGNKDEHVAVFTGSISYAPNRRAAETIIGEITPRVREHVPEFRVQIVGNGASTLAKLSRPQDHIELIDFVPSLQPFVAAASLSIAPLSVGTGVSNKVLEAMACRTAVVASPIACGDLPVVDNAHLLLAETPQQFADAIVRLCRDRQLRDRLADAGHELVCSRFDWEIVAARMEEVLLNAALRSATSLRHAPAAAYAAAASVLRTGLRK